MASDPNLPDGFTFSKVLDDRLKSSPLIEVYVQEPPPDRPAKGYVCGDVAPGLEWRDRACDGVSDVSLTFSLRCCGFSPAQALRTAQIAADLMRGWRPWPDRLDSGRVRMSSSTNVEKDDSIPSDVRYVTTIHYVID